MARADRLHHLVERVVGDAAVGAEMDDERRRQRAEALVLLHDRDRLAELPALDRVDGHARDRRPQAGARAEHHRVADAENVRGRSTFGCVVEVLGAVVLVVFCPIAVRCRGRCRRSRRRRAVPQLCQRVRIDLGAVLGAARLDPGNARRLRGCAVASPVPSISATSVSAPPMTAPRRTSRWRCRADRVAHDLAVAADRAFADRRLDEAERQLGRREREDEAEHEHRPTREPDREEPDAEPVDVEARAG